MLKLKLQERKRKYGREVDVLKTIDQVIDQPTEMIILPCIDRATFVRKYSY